MARDYYVPDFRLLFDGQADEDKDLRRVITSVSFTTGLDGADRVEVAVANQSRLWTDVPQFRVVPKDPVQVRLDLGYHPGGLVPVFFGEVTGFAAAFPAGGVPQVTVTAQDRRHRMKENSQAGWKQLPVPGLGNKAKPDDQVVQEVAASYEMVVNKDPLGGDLLNLVAAAAQVGLAADPDSGQKAIRRQQNETDYDLLKRIAKESGLEMLVDHAADDGGKTLRFLFPPAHTSLDVELEYGLSLIEFSPRESIVGQVDMVAANMRVPALGQTFGITLQVNDDFSELTLTVATSPVSKKDTNGAVVIDEPLTPATAPRRLLGELLTRTNQRLTGSGSTIGDPRIRAGSVIQVAGIGERFGGRYRVTSATHTIDGGGYKTKFEVRKELGLNKLPKVVQKAVPAKKKPAGSS